MIVPKKGLLYSWKSICQIPKNRVLQMQNNMENFSEEESLHHFNKTKNNNDENVIHELLPTEFNELDGNKFLLKDVVSQIIVSSIANCTVIQAGINMAYSTVLEDGLKKDLSVTTDQTSWIVSLVTISLPLGSLIVGPLMDLFGRKKICLISCLPSIISWLLLIAANSVTVIYIARIIAGISGGLSTVSLVYISEITHPQIRPMLLCCNSVFVSFGILLTYCLGAFLSWNKIAIVFLALHIGILFAILSIPESPYWLICFGSKELEERKSQIEAILKLLNKSEPVYQQELKRINDIFLNHNSNNKSKKSLKKKCLYYYQKLKASSVYKPTIILFTFFLIQELAGTYVIIFYTLSVFESLGGVFGKGLDKYGAMVILGVLRFFMSILTALFSKKFGRRIICMTSGLGMAFSMFLSVMYLNLISSSNQHGKVQEIMAEQKWILLIIILLYVCTSSLGFVAIPWTLIGELLPISVRGVLGGVIISFAYIIMFAMIKSYPFMIIKMGVQGTFFFFGAISLIGTIFVYIFLPETLGKSFSEIESYFDNTNRLDN